MGCKRMMFIVPLLRMLISFVLCVIPWQFTMCLMNDCLTKDEKGCIHFILFIVVSVRLLVLCRVVLCDLGACIV